MSAISTEVARQENGPAGMVMQYGSDFADVLPSHIKKEAWLRLAVGVLRRDKNVARIAQNNPGSFMQALLDCARLGHEPATENYYLVPFGNEIQGIEGYRGVIERIYRAGAVTSVKAELVYSNDRFVWNPNTMDRPLHEVDWFSDRGEVLGAYSYAVMREGGISRVIVINQQYIAKVRKESKGSGSATSPWQKWPEAMILKTVCRRLEAFVPTSSEYMRERLRAVRDVQAETDALQSTSQVAVPDHGGFPQPSDDVVDAEIIHDDDAPALPGDQSDDPWAADPNADPDADPVTGEVVGS